MLQIKSIKCKKNQTKYIKLFFILNGTTFKFVKIFLKSSKNQISFIASDKKKHERY